MDRLMIEVAMNAMIIKAKGMEAENQAYVQAGSEPPYREEHFNAIAAAIGELIDV